MLRRIIGWLRRKWRYDGYRVCYRPRSGSAGWQTYSDEYDDLDAPISRHAFKLREGELRDGIYRLFPLRNGQLQAPPDGAVWAWKIEEGDLDEHRKIDTLREEIRDLKRRDQDGDDLPTDPGEAVQQARAQVALEALGSEEFMEEYGEKIAVEALGLGSSGGVDLEDIDEYGSLAVAVDAWNDPSGIEDRAKQVGKAFSAAMDGFDAGAGDDGDAAALLGEDEDGDSGPQSTEKSLSEQAADQDTGPDVSRPEARYRLRFSDQYTEEQVEAAREVLTDEEIAEIEEKRERDEPSVEPETDQPAAATDGGGEIESDPEAETDGGITGGTSVVINNPRLIDQMRGILGDRSELELQEIARADNAPPTPPERDALRVLRRDDSVWGGTEYERRKVVRRVARDLLRGEPVADGGHQARQPLGGLKPRHIVGVLIILGLLFQGGGDSAS